MVLSIEYTKEGGNSYYLAPDEKQDQQHLMSSTVSGVGSGVRITYLDTEIPRRAVFSLYEGPGYYDGPRYARIVVGRDNLPTIFIKDAKKTVSLENGESYEVAKGVTITNDPTKRFPRRAF